jgi:hypothetical protein
LLFVEEVHPSKNRLMCLVVIIGVLSVWVKRSIGGGGLLAPKQNPLFYNYLGVG